LLFNLHRGLKLLSAILFFHKQHFCHVIVLRLLKLSESVGISTAAMNTTEIISISKTFAQ